jgi:hypothetical protein
VGQPDPANRRPQTVDASLTAVRRDRDERWPESDMRADRSTTTTTST